MMRPRAGLLALVLASGVGAGAASAQDLQPGMRTMMQQGGIEPGPLLGQLWPGPAREPDGYEARHPAALGRPLPGDARRHGRLPRAKAPVRRRFAG